MTYSQLSSSEPSFANRSGSKNRTNALWLFLLLTGVQAILCVVLLAVQPADPKNAYLFGFSKVRIAFLAFFVMYVLADIFLMVYLCRRQKSFVMLVERLLAGRLVYAIIILITLIAAVLGFRLLEHPPAGITSYQFERIQPVLVWLCLSAAEAFALLVFLKWDDVRALFVAFHRKFSHAPFQDKIPALTNKYISLSVLIIFLIIIVLQLPSNLSAVEQADVKYHRAIPTIGDDCGYQALAVNLMNGFGYADWICQPIEAYHFDLTSEPGVIILEEYNKHGIPQPYSTFYRAPGLPLLLGATYSLFGNESIVARRLMALLFWLCMVFLPLIGWLLAGWAGSLAGGLAALYSMNSSPMILEFDRILTEIPAAFWLTLFALLFCVYLNRNTMWVLLLSALSFGMAYLTRMNFFTAFPFLVLFLFYKRRHLSHILLFILAVLLPLVAWIYYASSSSGRLVLLPTQGQSDFPSFNNVDVLEGIGEERLLQGEWNPGFVLNDKGELSLPAPYRNTPKRGENGWVKGLTFWKDNLPQLPRLFYVKMWKNFWFDAYDGAYVRRYPIGINLIGVAFLLMSPGFRTDWRFSRISHRLKPAAAIIMQLVLVAFLAFTWDSMPFWGICIVWFLIFIIALLFPYGRRYIPQTQPPVWFLAFVASHLITTILYGGARFHFPLDPLMMLFGIMGILLTIYHALKTDVVLAAAALLSLLKEYVFRM